MVIWFIGLSGSGKSTIGEEVCRLWKSREKNVVLVDGDDIRDVFSANDKTKDYSIEARRENARRIRSLCHWLDKQDVNVVCNILSIFEESHEWNRQNYSDYYEIFIDVPMQILEQREVKNLYSAYREGKMNNVVGLDIPFSPPQKPNLIVDNSNELSNFNDTAEQILEYALSRKNGKISVHA
jgi:adenylylsulfate kinase